MLDKGHALLKRPCIISCVRVRALAALKLWRWCGCHIYSAERSITFERLLHAMEAQAGGVIVQLRADMEQALLLARLHLQVRSLS